MVNYQTVIMDIYGYLWITSFFLHAMTDYDPEWLIFCRGETTNHLDQVRTSRRRPIY